MSANKVLRHSLAVTVHLAKVGLREEVPLVGSLAEPRDGLRVVLPHTSADTVHQAEVDLRADVSLVTRQTPKPHRCLVIPALVCGFAVFQRPCHCFAAQRERENATGHESCDALFHGSPASGTTAAINWTPVPSSHQRH